MKPWIVFIYLILMVTPMIQAQVDEDATHSFLRTLDSEFLYKRINQASIPCRSFIEYKIRNNQREKTGFEIRAQGYIECRGRISQKGYAKKKLIHRNGFLVPIWDINMEVVFQFEGNTTGEQWVFPVNQKVSDTWTDSMPRGNVKLIFKTEQDTAILDIDTEFIGETDIPSKFSTDLAVDFKYIPRTFTQEFIIEQRLRERTYQFINKFTGLKTGVTKKKIKKPCEVYRTL
ncbi:MAG TPA: hypothetical protein PLB63_01600 [Planctomycetota bacterium]|nr:hypothetical protein [Planctomycetota bacterium]HQA99638.1 hypothetical protein [Planctomycetota bacterium]